MEEVDTEAVITNQPPFEALYGLHVGRHRLQETSLAYEEAVENYTRALNLVELHGLGHREEGDGLGNAQ